MKREGRPMLVTIPHATFADGSAVAPADVPGLFWAVTPRGLRLRDAADRLVKLYRSPEAAAADLAGLGYGPAATTKQGA